MRGRDGMSETDEMLAVLEVADAESTAAHTVRTSHIVALMAVPLLWGTFSPVMKFVLNGSDPPLDVRDAHCIDTGMVEKRFALRILELRY